MARPRPLRSRRHPPASRSSTETTPQIVCPASCSAAIAASVEPPVVTTSSTTRQRSSAVEQRALDTALQAVGLGVLAHEEALCLRPARKRRAGDRVGAHRHAADGRGLPFLGARGQQSRKRLKTLGSQDRALGVYVVGGDGPARERDLADHERVRSQLRDQLSAARRACLRLVAGWTSSANLDGLAP